MNVSTRLILLLTLAVSAVMAVAGYLMLRQSEHRLVVAAHDEVRAHALTLRLALEEDYRTGRALDAQRLVNRLRENTGVYGVLLFDEAGRVTVASSRLPSGEVGYVEEARRAITTGAPVRVERRIDGRDVFTVIMPLEAGAGRVGAVEVAQEVSFIRADIGLLRRDMALTTLLLCLTIFLVVWFVTRLSLARRIGELLAGAVAVGKGNLDYRVAVPPHSGEFTRLAAEFNRMADHLAAQRRAAAREAEERLELERRLRHSERLAAVGQLAAGIAHEMGAPLQVIDGRAKQLQNNPDAPLEMRQRNLTIIRAQAERITRIVRQLLNLARPYTLRRREVRLRRAVAGVLELLETSAARQGVVLELAPGEDVAVQADADLLHQALLNVCSNGLQAMAAGGRLRVECLKNAGAKGGRSFAAVRVTDTGPGVPPEYLPRIFEPFFTTKEVGSGTGLGLPVSSRFIEEHGGWIEAANDPDGGAIFTIYLPQHDATGEHAVTTETKKETD
jgi:signal transduction histidine kinase